MPISERGQVHRALHDAKGRERPRVAFRAAGRAKRGGRSRPFAVLARVRSERPGARTALFGWELGNYGRKTERKAVRKTVFKTVCTFTGPAEACSGAYVNRMPILPGEHFVGSWIHPPPTWRRTRTLPLDQNAAGISVFCRAEPHLRSRCGLNVGPCCQRG
jgi:hypothetical protein